MGNDRIIASSLIYGRCPFETALQEIARLGFDRFELALEPDLCPHYDLLSATPETDERFARAIEQSGLTVNDLNIGDSMRTPTSLEDIRTRHQNTLRLAKRLGVRKVVFAAGIVFPDTDIPALRKTMYAYYADLAPIARAMGITLCVEAPHKITIAETPEGAADFWAHVDPSIGCSLDTAHVVFGGGDPVEAVQKYASRIRNVHLRDGVPGNTFVPYGTGSVDFQGFFDALRAIDYRDTMTIEFLAPDVREAEAVIDSAKRLFAGLRI